MRRTLLSLTLALGLLPLTDAADDPAQQQRKAMDHYKRGEDRLKVEKFEEAATERAWDYFQVKRRNVIPQASLFDE